MSRGGKRSGAGRKKGVQNRLTVETIAKAAEAGEMPLDLILRYMNGDMKVWQHKRSETGRLMYERNPDNPDLTEPVMEMAPLDWKDRVFLARTALPYTAPRLQSIEFRPRSDLSQLSDEQLDELITLKRRHIALIRGR